MLKLFGPSAGIIYWVYHMWRKGDEERLLSWIPLALGLACTLFNIPALTSILALGLGAKSAWAGAVFCGALVVISGISAVVGLWLRVRRGWRVSIMMVLAGLGLNVVAAAFTSGSLVAAAATMDTGGFLAKPYTFSAPGDAYQIDLPDEMWTDSNVRSDTPTFTGTTRWSMFHVVVREVIRNSTASSAEALHEKHCSDKRWTVLRNKSDRLPNGNQYTIVTASYRDEALDMLTNCATLWVARSETLVSVTVGSHLGPLANSAEVIARFNEVSDKLLLSIR